MELKMTGTVIYVDTFTLSEQQLHYCPHITLSSNYAWDSHNVNFIKPKRILDEEMGSLYCLSVVKTTTLRSDDQSNETVFCINQIKRKILSLKQNLKLNKPSFDSGKSDVVARYTFQSSDRYKDVTAQDLSEYWGISILTAAKILKKTT